MEYLQLPQTQLKVISTYLRIMSVRKRSQSCRAPMLHVSPPAQFKRSALGALILVGGLALARTVFCFLMPEVIGGWRTFDISGDMLVLSLPFLIIGYYLFFIKKYQHLGLILITPGLYLLSNVSAFQAQVAIFHFGRSFPLIDQSLGYIDSLCSFGWRAYFDWTIAHNAYRRIISLAYQSIWIQPLMLGVASIMSKRVSSYFVLQVSLPLSLTLTCVIAAFLPALGAYQFHGMSADHHALIALEFTDQMTAPMMWLRQAELPNAIPHFHDLRLITFPSWHAATAIIFMMSAWPMKWLRYIFCILNILMLLATPVQGSHYFTDILVGSLVGLLSHLISSYLLQSRAAPNPDREDHSTNQAPQFA